MYTTDLRVIGKRLAEYRNNLGWTQADAAEASHLSESNYSRIENGKSKMKLSTMIKICNGLNIPIEEVLMSSDPEPDHISKFQEFIERCSTKELKTLSRYIQYHLWFHK